MKQQRGMGVMKPIDLQDAARIAAMKPSEYRLEYQKRYYQANKQKAQEYQRRYNLTHKKKSKGGKGKAQPQAPREVVRSTFNTADIMHTRSPEKVAWMFNKILKGERLFTM